METEITNKGNFLKINIITIIISLSDTKITILD